MITFLTRAAAAKRIADLGLPFTEGTIATAAGQAVNTAIAADPSAGGTTFTYQGRDFIAAKQQASWQVFLLDGLGGQRHLLDLVRAPVSYGHLSPAGIFTKPSFVKRG